MTVGITDEYRNKLIELMDKRWNKAKKTFTVKELQELIGKIARLGEACRWIFHLLPHLYASVDYAIKQNKCFYISCSSSFRKLLESIKSAKKSNLAEANFAMKTSIQLCNIFDLEIAVQTTSNIMLPETAQVNSFLLLRPSLRNSLQSSPARNLPEHTDSNSQVSRALPETLN